MVCIIPYKSTTECKDWNFFSSCLTLNGGIPQGSWLGPFIFIVLIDGLRPSCQTHKYLDDTTFTEILSCNDVSHVSELRQWSIANNMLMNIKLKKWSLLCHIHSPYKVFPISKIDTFKLLGIYVSRDFFWNNHVTN